MGGTAYPEDNGVARAQAEELREQARAGGLRFDAYLPPRLADWLLERIAQGAFADPSEAVFAILGEYEELEPHHDLRDELLRRRLQVAIDDPGAGIPHEQVLTKIERWQAEPRPVPARWEKSPR